MLILPQSTLRSILYTTFACLSDDKAKIRPIFVLLDVTHCIFEAAESRNIVACDSLNLLISSRRHGHYHRAAANCGRLWNADHVGEICD